MVAGPVNKVILYSVEFNSITGSYLLCISCLFFIIHITRRYRIFKNFLYLYSVEFYSITGSLFYASALVAYSLFTFQGDTVPSKVTRLYARSGTAHSPPRAVAVPASSAWKSVGRPADRGVK